MIEEREATLSSGSAEGTVQWDPTGEAVETKEKGSDEAMQPLKPVTVRFVLEESSGYMEPMLRILAIMHTVISFFCIIGYYCLKVWLELTFSRFVHGAVQQLNIIYMFFLSLWVCVCMGNAGVLGGF